MKNVSLFFTAIFFASCSFAQLNQSLNASEILLGLQKLNTLGSVLYVAAHPDDENTRLLAYLANERKYRTAYLSITRGDGGQNLIGKEQGEMLGLIRTQELLAARRVDGAEQYFTRANDFGYSKNPEETFAIWNKDSILADVVYAIRKFRPDVIICRFPTTGEGGHGHHTASAMLAVEAFDLAADPSRFPEQLAYVDVWQAKRIFWNTFNFGSNNTTSPDQMKTDVGAYNALLGKGYGEIASESRSMHKSQGFGSARQRGSNQEYFKWLKGDSAKTDMFEGINSSWQRLPGDVSSIMAVITSAIQGYNPSSPEYTAPLLIDLHKKVSSLEGKDPETTYWKQVKLKEIEKLIIACSGLWLETSASDFAAIPGQDIQLTTQVVARNKGSVKLNSITYPDLSDTLVDLSLHANELYTFRHKEQLASGAAYSNPYWLNLEHSNGLYTVPDVRMRGVPENEPACKVMFNISIQGFELQVSRPVICKYTDPVKGEVYRPLEVLPPATVNMNEKVFVFSGTQAKKINLTIKAHMTGVTGKLELDVGKGWTVEIKQPEFRLTNKGDEVTIEAIVTGPASSGRTVYPPLSALEKDFPAAYTEGQLHARLLIDGRYYDKSLRRIEYDHIPYQFLLADSRAGLVKVDIKTKGLHIAYIPGAGDDVPAALRQVGYRVTELTDEQLANADLSVYDAIITGVRAYNTNERLSLIQDRLLDYMKNGGNLIVQYNTNSRVGPLQAKIGPYPFTISRDRVTDERAEVRFLEPSHAVLNTPNKITSSDFEGWVQERGIYFATEPDPRYRKIFSINDPNDKISEGSLIIAPYGKGNFVYTGLAFFRELPAGVPGAYRLFVNMISLPKNKK